LIFSFYGVLLYIYKAESKGACVLLTQAERAAVSLERKDVWQTPGDMNCTYLKPLLAAAMTGCYD